MQAQYGSMASFRTIYIKEAHPLDEWQMDDNEKEEVCYAQPKSTKQRIAIARDFVTRFHYKLPLVVDPIANAANAAYAAWPERLYIIDERGVIAYKGKPGPFGFHPEEVEEWLKTYSAPQSPHRQRQRGQQQRNS